MDAATRPVDSDTAFCAAISRQDGSTLFGTATVARHWLLLEYRGAWAARATDDNTLPPAVRNWLNTQLSQRPESRLQFIRRPGAAQREAPLTLYYATTGDARHSLRRWVLDSYDALFDVDLAAGADVSTRPHYFVCVNGRRDQCCARLGQPVFAALAERLPEQTWQTTHIGGHRFAATLLALPAGAAYGFLTPDDVPALIAAHARGDLYLPRLRGRTYYAQPVQAADFFLRRARGNVALDGRWVQSVETAADGSWRVIFAAADGTRLGEVSVRRVPIRQTLVSCSPAKQKDAARYELVSLDT